MSATTPTGREHRFRKMIGRDPHESHRAASPLELLYDLTLVVAFSQAGTQMSHLLEVGHYAAAAGGFIFATFAICWAWINYSWLSSAFDNDDIFFRLATMVQMMGVLVLALGLPALFESLDGGIHLDNRIVVAGYVVMRLSTIALWLRVARHDPMQRRTALWYSTLIAIAQIFWTLLIVVNPPMPVTIALSLVIVVFEMAVPVIAERTGEGTPWHAHHIAERYSLLVIITLGEVVLGTIVAISAVVEQQGWTLEAGLLAFSGTALAFALWWVYFTMPSGELLEARRDRGFIWGYGHMVLFGSIAAAGAGLHVAAFDLEGVAHIAPTAAMLTIAIPVAIFTVGLLALYWNMLGEIDALHLWLIASTLVILAVSVVCVSAGASIGTGVSVAVLAPVAIIVGYETLGHRHQAAAIARVTGGR